MRKNIFITLVLTMVLLLGVCSIVSAAEIEDNCTNITSFRYLDAFDKDKVNLALKNVVFRPDEGPKTFVFDDGSSITLTLNSYSEGINQSTPLTSPLTYRNSLDIEYRSEGSSPIVVLIYTMDVTWVGHEGTNRATLVSHSDSFKKNLVSAKSKGTRGINTDGTYILVRGGWEANYPLIGGHVSHTYDFTGTPGGASYLSQIS